MLSVYKDEIRDAMYPRRGTVDKRFNIVNVMPPEHWDAERIKKLRKQLQLSQSLFAETMGVSVPAVVAWENGRTNPSSLACSQGGRDQEMSLRRGVPDALSFFWV